MLKSSGENVITVGVMEFNNLTEGEKGKEIKESKQRSLEPQQNKILSFKDLLITSPLVFPQTCFKESRNTKICLIDEGGSEILI